jgi:hypothetical protein
MENAAAHQTLSWEVVMQWPCTTHQQLCLPLAWSWVQQQVARLWQPPRTAQAGVQQLVVQQQAVAMVMARAQHQQQLAQHQQAVCRAA